MIEQDDAIYRERRDMCSVFAIESLLKTIPAGQPQIFHLALWVWQSRIKFNELYQKNKLPDDNLEFEWFNNTLKQVVDELKLPINISLSFQQIQDVSDINRLLQAENEVIVFGKTTDYKTPHMFHLGQFMQDVYGSRFESFQQTTWITDLADFFMRYDKVNIIKAKTEGISPCVDK